MKTTITINGITKEIALAAVKAIGEKNVIKYYLEVE